jgi:NADH-quinone oxidoreductase subunit I
MEQALKNHQQSHNHNHHQHDHNCHHDHDHDHNHHHGHDHHHDEVEEVEENPLTFKQYFKNIYEAVTSSLKGLMITTRYIWANDAVTIEYPEVKEVLPERSRSRLYNDADNCIACTQCALACPVDCIYIASKPRDKEAPAVKTNNGLKGNGTPIRLDLTQFTIDTALCCYCGLCTTVCPTECLTHTTDYEYSQYTVNSMKYDYLDEDVKSWRTRIVKTARPS